MAITAPIPLEKGKPFGRMTLRLGRVTPEATVATLWTARLGYWPAFALASNDGHVATVGSWYQIGGHEAVTLFDDSGRVLRDYPVESFATVAERATLPKFSINAVPTLIAEAHFERATAAMETKMAQPLRTRFGSDASPSSPSVLAVSLKSGRVVYFDPTNGKLLNV